MFRRLLFLLFFLIPSMASAQPLPVTQCVTTAVAGGTGDAITVPELPCIPTTATLYLTITNTNATTTPAITPAGGPTQVIVNYNKTALTAGELAANTYTILINNGTNWILMAGGTNTNISPQVNPINVTTAPINADNTGTFDTSVALNKVFGNTTNSAFWFPAGTYRIACGKLFSASSAITLLGEGEYNTTIRLDPGCGTQNPLITWTNLTTNISNLTIDLNNNSFTDGLAALQFTDSTTGLTGPHFSHIRIINAVRPGRLINLNTSGAGTFTNPTLEDSYMAYTNPGTTTDNCFAMGNLNSNVYTASFFSTIVARNTCINSSFQLDGAYGVFAYNNISGFAFGAGIFTLYDGLLTATAPTSDHDNIILGNIIHDSQSGYDTNNSTATGIENNCYRCTIQGNILYNLGGEGIRNYGSYTTITNNFIVDNGKTQNLIGNYLPAGISVVNGGREPYNSKQVFINSGNTIYDDGTHTQAFGVVAGNQIATDGFTTIGSNNYITGDSTLNYTIANVPNVSGTAIFELLPFTEGTTVIHDWTLTAKQVSQFGGSGVAALQFFPLDINTYRHFRLECDNLSPVSSYPIVLQFAEGSIPTWLTGSSYDFSYSYSTSASDTATFRAFNQSIGQIGPYNGDSTGNMPTNFVAKTGDLRITNHRKVWKVDGVGYGNSPGISVTFNGQVWYDDANSQTGIRVLASVGNIFGSCSLWGRQ